MRVSTKQLAAAGLDNILNQQGKLNKTQSHLSTGLRIRKPSDDPSGATRILGYKKVIQQTEQYQSNINIARQYVALEEGALGSVVSSLQRIRELAIQGNNASQSDETRLLIADEVQQRLDELLALANTKNANGEYVFSGFKGHTQPFSKGAGNSFVYNGDQGQRFLQVSPSRQIATSDSGADIFLRLKTGNGTFATSDNSANTGTGIISQGVVSDPAAIDGDSYTITFTTATNYQVTDSLGNVETSGVYQDGGNITFNGHQVAVSGVPAAGDTFSVVPSSNQSLFSTVQNLADALRSNTSNTNFHNTVASFLSDVDLAEQSIVGARSSLGSRLNALDSQTNINEDSILRFKETVSNIEDLDYAEAVSDLNLQLVGLQAAQQAFVKVQGLSLFNFLR